MNYQIRSIPQQGFTALELIIVLIIGFSIIGLSTSKMGEMMDSSKAALAMDSIVSLSTGIKELTPLATGMTGKDVVTQLSDSGSAPKTLKVLNDAFINQWNQPIDITIQPPDDFTITYPAVSKVACNKLVKGLLPYFGISVKDKSNAIKLITKNTLPTDIITACKAEQPISLIFNSDVNAVQATPATP